MIHVGIVCPNSPGHVNPMIALADAVRARGRRVTFFLMGEPPAPVAAAGFEAVSLGGTVFPAEEYRAAFLRLGSLQGRAALDYTIALFRRSAEAALAVGPGVVREAGVTHLLVDQASTTGGTVADQLGLPFATVCNALILHPDPDAPPYFTPWVPGKSGWTRLRNRIAWAGLGRKTRPILDLIREHRRRHGLTVPRRLADTWSTRLQISQQPAAFEFPRSALPASFRFAGPLRLPGGYPRVDFPWDRLDGRPLIYASLGTLQNRVASAFRTIAEACDGLEAQLVISTGHGVAPEALGDLPGRPVVVPYAPQLELLSRAALAVTHAGLNTALDALSLGVPMVATPVTNEQPGIAARIAWTGSGEALPSLDRLTPAAIRPAILRVLRDPSYRHAAARIRTSILAAGGASRAAEWIDAELIGTPRLPEVVEPQYQDVARPASAPSDR
ncbi:glycosyltransferase [Aquisphaera giovannonii]|uniref:glycosyltransferase n=1 Tax=Aquisphaera giovannonii TaxID=406548 RepID=UPI00143D7E96|nr:nucleotide disphospho-sugar-binding domain-containing protein [Aquisphaera giovannonii]